MADKAAHKSGANSAGVQVKRGPGHRAVDARDAIAELTERAQEISLEAGSKVAIAMKDVVSAAAGIAGFAVESARDLVNFMVRRGQMTPEEADKLMREAETAHAKRPARERKRATASEIQMKERAIQRAKQAAAREKEMQRMMNEHAAMRAKPVKKSKPAKRAKPAKSKKAKKRR